MHTSTEILVQILVHDVTGEGGIATATSQFENSA